MTQFRSRTNIVSVHSSPDDDMFERAVPPSLIDAPPLSYLPRVVWYREPHLRKLYLLTIFLLIASATTGYDGMLINTSLQMDTWESYFPEVVGNPNKLGLLINMFNIGSVVSFFIVPYMADNLGRKPTIVVGAAIMCGGALLSAFCNGYTSKKPSINFPLFIRTILMMSKRKNHETNWRFKCS